MARTVELTSEISATSRVPSSPTSSLGGCRVWLQVSLKPGRKQPSRRIPNGYGTLTLPQVVGQPGAARAGCSSELSKRRGDLRHQQQQHRCGDHHGWKISSQRVVVLRHAILSILNSVGTAPPHLINTRVRRLGWATVVSSSFDRFCVCDVSIVWFDRFLNDEFRLV
jgi:hypothetical protein